MRMQFVGAILAATFLTAPAAYGQGARFGIAGTGAFSLEEGDGSGEFGVSALAELDAGGDSPIGFRLDATYLFDPELLQFTGNVLYKFLTSEGSKFHPYLIGGGGYVTNTDFDGGDFLIDVGAGFNIIMERGSLTPFVEGRFINQFATDPFTDESRSIQSLQAMLGLKFGGN